MKPDYIEAGKYIRYRNGERGRVLCTDRNNPAHTVVTISDDGVITLHMSDGGRYTSGVDDHDIIGPWVEPPPWPDYPTPPWWVCIIADWERNVWACSKPPKLEINKWHHNGHSTWYHNGYSALIPPEYAPDFGDLPPERCIIFRPGYEREEDV